MVDPTRQHGWHLAELNIATLVEPLDHPASSGFADALEEINAVGEASPGFVWRLQDEAGDATSLRVFPDPATIVNLTVWESVQSLRDYAYRTSHGDFLRRRAEWFQPRQPGEPHLVMWWVPPGHQPSLEEAKARLWLLRDHGPSPFAFTFAAARDDDPAKVTVHRVELDDEGSDDLADALALVGELNAQLQEEYPQPGANHFALSAGDVAPGSGAFLLVREAGTPVAIGAVRRVGEPDGAAEIKRMYTRPSARGRRVGAAVVALLEAEARALGATSLVLETGQTSTAAIALYERAGFSRCDCWGEYLETPDTSACYRKQLV